MIDVGGNPLGKLKQLRVGLSEIKEVVFTHFHIDHIYGLPSLLWGMWLDGRTEPLTVYCAKTFEECLERWLDVMGVAEWPIDFHIRIRTYDWEKEAELIQYENGTLSTFPSIHVGPTAGVKVVKDRKVLIYSADTMLNQWIKDQRKVDVLIHEATTAFEPMANHTSMKEVIEYYQVEQMEKVVFVHLTDGEDYEAVLKNSDSSIKGKLNIGYDLMRIEL